jgi:hypothetical protein
VSDGVTSHAPRPGCQSGSWENQEPEWLLRCGSRVWWHKSVIPAPLPATKWNTKHERNFNSRETGAPQACPAWEWTYSVVPTRGGHQVPALRDPPPAPVLHSTAVRA